MTAALSPTDRPRLRRGVRAGTDPLSDRSILLFPEGILFLNETAAAVIHHCDGNRTVADVVHAIRAVYDGVARDDVMSLVQDLLAQRLMVVDRG
jgi:coenzyme PQQ biosynthesis protein PqqD